MGGVGTHPVLDFAVTDTGYQGVDEGVAGREAGKEEIMMRTVALLRS